MPRRVPATVGVGMSSRYSTLLAASTHATPACSGIDGRRAAVRRDGSDCVRAVAAGGTGSRAPIGRRVAGAWGRWRCDRGDRGRRQDATRHGGRADRGRAQLQGRVGARDALGGRISAWRVRAAAAARASARRESCSRVLVMRSASAHGAGRLALCVDDGQLLDDASAALVHQLVVAGEAFVVVTLAPRHRAFRMRCGVVEGRAVPAARARSRSSVRTLHALLTGALGAARSTDAASTRCGS